jgi:hypothetical protein
LALKKMAADFAPHPASVACDFLPFEIRDTALNYRFCAFV